jgi:hypothetical protein
VNLSPAELRERAQECDKQAYVTTDPISKRMYRELARQWRDLADETERHGLRWAGFPSAGHSPF